MAKCKAVREAEQASFQHTQLGVYLAGAFGLLYIGASSAQSIVDKYHFSKKWFYLYGVLCCFAYLYLRPFVRRGLGSAHRGFLNFYSLYIVWLCSALFCHLPSLEALGFDIKADVSLGLSIAASSLLVLGVLHGLQAAAVHLKWLRPTPGVSRQAAWSCIILNSLTLAAACSTYFQLCGNGAPGDSQGSARLAGTGLLQEAVCSTWLAPIPTREYPNFSAWMLYGERNASSNSSSLEAGAAVAKKNVTVTAAICSSAGADVAGIANLSSSTYSSYIGNSSPSVLQYPPVAVTPVPKSDVTATNATSGGSSLAEFVLALPLHGPEDGEAVISPVFTMWITLVALYISEFFVAVGLELLPQSASVLILLALWLHRPLLLVQAQLGQSKEAHANLPQCCVSGT
eukprot:GHRR01022526.1.p1 GENE.GHRR01022526.1~~GHRR01022526.1.p1  ORF type:complete len:400 (+),score=129.69 GHRR01022526.1:397-1596(+)